VWLFFKSNQVFEKGKNNCVLKIKKEKKKKKEKKEK
jgi:hypothetical protein